MWTTGRTMYFTVNLLYCFSLCLKILFHKGKRKRKTQKKSPCSFIHIHKEKRIHRYADFKAWHWGLPSRKRENKYNSHPETEFPCRQNVKYPQISNCIELHKTGERFSLEKGFWTNLEKASFPFRNERLLSQGQAGKVKGKANVSRSFPLRWRATGVYHFWTLWPFMGRGSGGGRILPVF